VAPITADEALATLTPRPGLVVLMCGLAGSGKTTFSQALEAKGFVRLSLDEEIWRRFGRYGIDYPADDYGGHVAAARAAIRGQLAEGLARRTPTVVDSAFWSRAHRDDFCALVLAGGGEVRLVYLRASEAVLRARLRARSGRFDANAALPIDAATLAGFLKSFEAPSDEGEMVVEAG
jgi:predicted kinase